MMRKLLAEKKLVFTLFILVAIFLTLLLVFQRQEIRKRAELSTPIERCRVRVEAVKEDPPTLENNFTYAVTFHITSLTRPRDVVLQLYRCICPEGAGNPAGQCHECDIENRTISITPDNPTEVVLTMRREEDCLCGSFQADIYLLTVEDNDQCYREGPVWGGWQTNIDCPCPSVTPTPTGQASPTPTPTGTTTPPSTPTPTPTGPTSTPTSTPTAGPSPTPTATPQATGTPPPAPTPTDEPVLPEAGITLPTALVTVGGLVLALLGMIF